MPGTAFQITVGTSAVQLSAEAELANAKVYSGVRVTVPAANSGLIYYGYDNTVTTSTGVNIPNGVPYIVFPSEMQDVNKRPQLSNLWFISGTAAQVVTGEVI